MRLTCYPTLETPPAIRPAPAKREWMTQTPGRFAYRCLPLVIANSHGWEVLVDRPFAATWNGGTSATDLQISFLDDSRSMLPASHFGQGVLSFQVGYLFETEELYNLWIMGPINWPKDGVMPLCGIVETDWIPYTFTMNWLFTRPGTVRFESGEPFCHVFPIPRQLLSTFDPEIRDLEEAPEKSRVFAAWRASRGATVDRLVKGELKPTEEVWSKHYLRGETPEGEVIAKDHETKLVIKPFLDRTSRQVTQLQRELGAQEVFLPARAPIPAAAPRVPSPERVVRIHIQESGSHNIRVAFPDPLLSAVIDCRDGLDELVQQVVVPFRQWLQQQEGAASQCYLWFLRGGNGRDQLELHLHGPEDQGPNMRRWLEEAVAGSQTEALGGTLVWTGYCREGATPGDGQTMMDPCYASLITVCLAHGCEFVLSTLQSNGESRITHGSRRRIFLRALISGLSSLGLPVEMRFAYLAYHRDLLLREVVAHSSGGASLQSALSALDIRVEALGAALEKFRELIAEEWTDAAGQQPESAELGAWQRSLSDLHGYVSRSCDPVPSRDRWAAERAFVPLFKACHGLANQSGLTPIDEAFWCHLLVRARPQA